MKIYEEVLELAWQEIMFKQRVKSVQSIQRVTRFVMVQIKNNQLTEAYNNHLHNGNLNYNANIIIKNLKMFLVRKRYLRIKRAVGYISGYIRMKFISSYFYKIKKSVVII